jgi:DHA2 family multidrug resistance protein
VNAASIRADAPAVASSAVANPWLIAVVVALASFMEVLDTTIANVALPYIAGGMGVSEDEASWVVTTYLVSNAIILTASPFLARMLGRKAFFLICLGLFTLSSLLCGFAPNLNALLLFRILQGFGGGGMVPVAQSILADSFPPQKRGQAFALFGVAVVVAPVVGPTLGGWISDNWSWQWCFLINAPVGVIAMGLIAVLLREPKRLQCRSKATGSTSSASYWSRPSSVRSRSCSTGAWWTTGSPRLSSSRSRSSAAWRSC